VDLGADHGGRALARRQRPALAVLVVATPCPLILAAPIALIAGVSRAARVGVIVKRSVTIERLGRARSVVFDKTGTLTTGHPGVRAVTPLDGHEAGDLLRLAPGRGHRRAGRRPRGDCGIPEAQRHGFA
jgi:P-type E1-E2 ATPase